MIINMISAGGLYPSALMKALAVVKIEVGRQVFHDGGHGLVRREVYVFVLLRYKRSTKMLSSARSPTLFRTPGPTAIR
jgi:hypothetical protein